MTRDDQENYDDAADKNLRSVQSFSFHAFRTMPTLVAAEITREEFDELKKKKDADIVATREAHANDDGPEEGWFGGIAKDVAIRLPLYKSDWTITTGEEAKKILAV